NSAGLNVGAVTTASNSAVAAGLVISSDPAAGTAVDPGSAVNLEVSSGAAKVAVTNVVGSTQSAAEANLTSIGLTVGTVTTASSSTAAPGIVISSDPPAGTAVDSASAVNLEVSGGPAKVAVPNLVGSTQSAAEASLTSVGLTVGTVTTVSSSILASGLVIR